LFKYEKEKEGVTDMIKIYSFMENIPSNH
jgi:hypothetical protein